MPRGGSLIGRRRRGTGFLRYPRQVAKSKSDRDPARAYRTAGRFPLPTTEEWGEGKGEGIPISHANSMEAAPLPNPLPARASQGEGAGGFRDGGGIQTRPPARPARRATVTLALRANSVRVSVTMAGKPAWAWLAAPVPNPRRGPPPAAFARTTSARGSNSGGGESADETGYRISFPIVVRS